MVNLLAHFEGSELVDFIHFVNLLVHKLQVCLFLYILFVFRLSRSRVMTARSIQRIGRAYWSFECSRYESHVPTCYGNGRHTHA
jgi:hypothetical protein